MSWLNEQLERVKHLFSKRRSFDADLAEEMRLHVDLRLEENPSVQREARVRFGNIARLQEDSRAAWGWPTLESIVQDVRYGTRTLIASPAFTIAAVVSLTLGIGANTAIFSLLNATMLRTLPVKDPGRLVSVEAKDGPYLARSLWEQVRDRVPAFDEVLAFSDAAFDLSTNGERQLVTGLLVSGNYFQVLGVGAVRGRVIIPEDDKRGCGANGPVAVISHRLWQNHFNSDPSIVGRTLTLNRGAFEIAGVTPAWFTGLSVDRPFDVAIPIACEPLVSGDYQARGDSGGPRMIQNILEPQFQLVVARLKPGIALANAGALLKTITPEILRATAPPGAAADDLKAHFAQELVLRPLSPGLYSMVAKMYRDALFTLQAVVGLILLIACANVANLLLARATARQRELSVRLAIGAGRARIVRQLLTESLLLASTGAVAGLLLAEWGTKLLIRLLSRSGPMQDVLPNAPMDLHVFAFTGLAVVLTTLLFGFLPALRAASTAPNDVLKEGGRNSIGSRRVTLSKAMLAIQLGLALTLLSAAGLFGESFRRILSVDLGFNPHNVTGVLAMVPERALAEKDRNRVFDEGLERIRQVPGVESASRSLFTQVGTTIWPEDLRVEGYQPKGIRGEFETFFNATSSGYLATMGAKLIAGRDFDARDTLTAPLVMIVGEMTARQFWGNSNPIGRTVAFADEAARGVYKPYRVIGVVNDMTYWRLSEKRRKIAFLALSQLDKPQPWTTFELRLGPDAPMSRVMPLARAALMDTNKDFSLMIQTLDSQISNALIEPRSVAAVSGFFGAVALILAATGLYGVVAYSTARRKAEIGLRMALGASYRSVVLLVLRDIGMTLAMGAVLGVASTLVAGRFVKSLVFGVQPADPAVLGAALAMLLTAAAVAAYIPARRAANLDPMESLRIE